MMNVSFLSLGLVGLAQFAIAQEMANTTAGRDSLSADRIWEVSLSPQDEVITRRCLLAYRDPLTILAPLSGVVRLSVEDGQQVSTDDPLAQFDASQLERDLARIEARLRVQTERIDATAGALREMKDALQALEIGRLDREIALLEERLGQIVDLVQAGRVGDAERTATEQKLVGLRETRRESELRHRMALIEEELQLAAQQQEVFGLSLDRDALKDRIAASRITAPQAGLVSEVINDARAGAELVVREGAPLFTLVDPEALSARLDVTEDDWLVMRDAQVSVVGASGEDPIPAAVASVTPKKDEVFSNAAFSILLDLADGEGSGLAPDSNATCQFTVPRVAELPAVPLAAVTYRGDTPQVTVLRDDGTLERRDVTLEAQVRGLVQVSGGLSVGEKIVR